MGERTKHQTDLGYHTIRNYIYRLSHTSLVGYLLTPSISYLLSRKWTQKSNRRGQVSTTVLFRTTPPTRTSFYFLLCTSSAFHWILLHPSFCTTSDHSPKHPQFSSSPPSKATGKHWSVGRARYNLVFSHFLCSLTFLGVCF